ncbi:MAG: SusC/RagA family TonB-linked outer membrane protein, partial [Ginsengibacter sp.]
MLLKDLFISRQGTLIKIPLQAERVMKLTAFILLTICLQVSAESFSQKVSLSVKDAPLEKVIKNIKKQTGYSFFFNAGWLQKAKNVTIEVKDMAIGEALDIVFKDQPLSYTVINNTIVLKLKEVVPAKALQIPDALPPPIDIHGRVVNEKGEAMEGVTVSVKHTKQAIATNANGEFTISAKNGEVLVFTYVNYASHEVTVGSRDSYNITMLQQSSSLNDVVVIGYGTRQKKDVTGAISTVGPTEIGKSTALSPELAMQGQMPGVSVISGGGNPSARPTIRIRGVTSFNNADPLYVIDGIPVEEGGAGATPDPTNDPTRRTNINLYTIINPNDIESITVLKDASASAAYGVRGGNGVILITTKTGKKGRVKVDFDGVYGTQEIPKTYSFLNTQQYVKFVTDGYNANPELNGGVAKPIGQASKFGAVWDPASAKYLGNSPTYDWQDAIINHDAKIQNYNVRVSGANDNTSYNFSAAYANNDGPFLGVNSERYNISSNIKSSIGKYIETGLNLRLINENTHNPAGGFTGDLNAFHAAPWQAIYDKNNPYGYAALWTLNQPITPATFDHSPVWQSTLDAFVPITNYLGNLATSSDPFVHQTAFGSAFIQIQPVAGLKIKGTISGQQLTISNHSFTSFDNWQFSETPGNPYGSVKNPIPGTRYNQVGFGNSITSNLIKSLTVDYVHSFGKHNVNITLNASQEEWKWKTNGGGGFITTDNPDLRFIHPDGTQNAFDELHGNYALIGYFGRISYNYNSKYYLDVLTRRDGSSRFDINNHWGTFPAASAAWRISQEDFMKHISFLNDLKIRGGFGILGNEQTTPGWKYLSVAGSTPPSYNTGSPNNVNPGVAFGNFANKDLTWEKIRSANIGIDAMLFHNKLSLTIDYFHKVTKGIIQSVSLTPSAGFEYPADLNIADVLNRGFEFSAAYNKNFGKVNLSVSANLTTVHNEVLALSDHAALRGNGFSLEEGFPIGYLYGYKVAGIFQNQKEIDDWNASHKDKNSTQQKPGDIYFEDLYGAPLPGSTAHNLNKDSIINNNDQTYLGKTIPGYDYGFTLSANYGGFDLSAFFHGVGDVK